MGNTNKLKISWENDIWHSIGEQDVLNLRNQLGSIKNYKELRKRDKKKQRIVKEITMK